ncbi:hypothetical protein DPMN_090907 [Dreissena polymorpha]|uniref:Uncharacterized protein n=1 Tax=Dreissena polymorpha TaxID=45954 RepID=A0A9D4KYL1_DREPO|nr:hypothetical protein DPMN_090907 [Dreissena polymorpha]
MARQRLTRIPTSHGWCGCGLIGRGAPGLVIGPCIVMIDRIVIREVQYQLEVNRCRNDEVMMGRLRIDRIVMHMNRCRNEEIIVKAILGGCGLCGRCAPGLVIGPCIVEIDRIVI